jgi:hypothetical protein
MMEIGWRPRAAWLAVIAGLGVGTLVPALAAHASEFRICSDVSSQGAGQPCELSECLIEDDSVIAGVVGEACTASSTGGISAQAHMRYTFNTASPSGTDFLVWLRIVADTSWDPAEQYDCLLSNVTGVGALAFSITENDIIPNLLNPGCNVVTFTEEVCWARAAALAPVALDQGTHVLECSTFLNNSTGGVEAAGFDGLIFTTDLTYVPDEQDTACDDDDLFEAGSCFGNWGPNVVPAPPVPILGAIGALGLYSAFAWSGARALERRGGEDLHPTA